MDYTAIRHTFESLGEELACLGWNKPQTLIEGNGAVGKAVRDCRDDRCVGLLKNVLKGWAVEVKESSHKERKQMMKLCEAAWSDFKDAVNEGLDDQPSKAQSSGRKQVGQRPGEIRLRIQS